MLGTNDEHEFESNFMDDNRNLSNESLLSLIDQQEEEIDDPFIMMASDDDDDLIIPTTLQQPTNTVNSRRGNGGDRWSNIFTPPVQPEQQTFFQYLNRYEESKQQKFQQRQPIEEEELHESGLNKNEMDNIEKWTKQLKEEEQPQRDVSEPLDESYFEQQEPKERVTKTKNDIKDILKGKKLKLINHTYDKTKNRFKLKKSGLSQDEKRAANRESARRSRAKKRSYLQGLEKELASLKKQNQGLSMKMLTSQMENTRLRTILQKCRQGQDVESAERAVKKSFSLNPSQLLQMVMTKTSSTSSVMFAVMFIGIFTWLTATALTLQRMGSAQEEIAQHHPTVIEYSNKMPIMMAPHSKKSRTLKLHITEGDHLLEHTIPDLIAKYCDNAIDQSFFAPLDKKNSFQNVEDCVNRVYEHLSTKEKDTLREDGLNL